jgi:hypothetical protein
MRVDRSALGNGARSNRLRWVAVHESPYGTKRTWRGGLTGSALGARTDMLFKRDHFRFSDTLNWKRTALAGTVKIRKERTQFCSLCLQRTMHRGARADAFALRATRSFSSAV